MTRKQFKADEARQADNADRQMIVESQAWNARKRGDIVKNSETDFILKVVGW